MAWLAYTCRWSDSLDIGDCLMVTIVPETGDTTIIVSTPPTFIAPPSSKLVAFTYNLATASGLQTITGVGFKPSLIHFMTGISGGNIWGSQGWSDGVVQNCIEYQMTGNVYAQFGAAGIQRDNPGGTNYQQFTLSSMNPDGFTLSWGRIGTPTALAQISATCF